MVGGGDPAAARRPRAAFPRFRRPQPQPPRGARVRRRRRARAPAGAARPARARDRRAAVDPRSLRLVHRAVQHRQLPAERPGGLARRRSRPGRRRSRLCRRGPRRRSRVRRGQPPAPGRDAAARPRPQLSPERALLRDRPRDGARPRRARDRGRRVHDVQPVDPAGPDRPARPRSPLALDDGAAARERGALPDDVRRGSDRDHALRPGRPHPLREPVGGVDVRLLRGGAGGQAADDLPAPGRPRGRRPGVRER